MTHLKVMIVPLSFRLQSRESAVLNIGPIVDYQQKGFSRFPLTSAGKC